MATKIASYPQITSSLFNDIQWDCSQFRFIFKTERNEQIDLDLKTTYDNESISCFDDQSGLWNPETCSLTVKVSIGIANPTLLFGENGVVCRQGKIGLAIQWSSRDSRQRGFGEKIVFSLDQKNVSADLNLNFMPGTLRGQIDLQVAFFVDSSEKCTAEECFLANTAGFILGNPDHPSLTLRIDGEGSSFPIVYEARGKHETLWDLYCEWEDPEYDSFEDCVSLRINTDNPDYPQVSRQSPKYNPMLLVQILAACMTQLVTCLKDNDDQWDRMLSGKEMYEGSVMQAVKFYVDELDWDTSNIISLSKSVRTYLEGKFLTDENKNSVSG